MQNDKHSYYDSKSTSDPNCSHTLLYRHLWRGIKAAILGAGLVGIVFVSHILSHQVQIGSSHVTGTNAKSSTALTSGATGLSLTSIIYVRDVS